MPHEEIQFPRIAFCGPLGGGKTTIADYMAERFGGLRLSMAFPLKAVAAGYAAVNGLGKPDRAMLQKLSEYRAADTWLNIMEYNLRGRDNQPLFVDDMRFPDEADFLREQGFFLVRLNVSPHILDRRRRDRDGQLPAPERLNHESEAHWPTLPVDFEADGNLSTPHIARTVLGAFGAWYFEQQASA